MIPPSSLDPTQPIGNNRRVPFHLTALGVRAHIKEKGGCHCVTVASETLLPCHPAGRGGEALTAYRFPFSRSLNLVTRLPARLRASPQADHEKGAFPMLVLPLFSYPPPRDTPARAPLPEAQP